MGKAANDTTSKRLDERVARALAAMEGAPGARWSLRALANIAGMSRAVFARRFTAELGVPPLRWLAERRLGLALELLLETDATLTQIATHVGYGSAFALGKAFKRMVGMSPGIFRERVRMVSADTFRAAA
jgi:transcriptional regulator GlxA family with amidase domain